MDIINTTTYFDQRIWDFAELPFLINIETFMGCNLRCRMCPVPLGQQGMGGRQFCAMSPEVFRIILDEISEQPRQINLTQLGEPLLNPNIVDFVALSHQVGHHVSLTTNGTLLTSELGCELLKAGINRMVFSFDGGTKRTYESLRCGAKFEHVIQNIQNFYSANKKYGFKCEVQIHNILSNNTERELDIIKQLWSGVANVFHIPLDDWGGKLQLPSDLGLKRTKVPSRNVERYPCDLLWTNLTVSAEGQIMLCCHDYKLLSRLPNISEKPLRKIWQQDVAAERYRQIEGNFDSPSCCSCQAWVSRPKFYHLQEADKPNSNNCSIFRIILNKLRR